MAESILDGSGTGRRATVDESYRLATSSIVKNKITEESEIGQSFVIASDFISLTTTGSFNGCLYIKNTNESRDLKIYSIRTCSTGSGSVQVKMLKSPTAGTLISDANNAYATPSNAGYATTFNSLAYSASGDGKTVTDGDHWTQFTNNSPGHSTQEYQGSLILPNGSSMAILAKPSASVDFCIEVQCWFE